MNRLRHHTKRSITLILSIIVGAVLVYSGMQAKNATRAGSTVDIGTSYRIAKVIDGDTAEINISGQNRRVRFIGMDTPEVVDPRKTVQCFGREASNRAHQLLDGQMVSLEYDNNVGEQDKYGRILAYVVLPDGTNYNKKMIADGYAHEYTYSNQFYKYQSEFKDAQTSAQLAQLGLWSLNTCGGNTTQPAK